MILMRTLLILVLACSTCLAQEVRRALPVSSDEGNGDAVAKFLAGIPLVSPTPLARLQQEPGCRAHSAEFEKLWKRYNEHYFVPIRLWSSVELSPRISPTAPVFYFFGGPDILSCLGFYPDATDYLLGGLEPVGSIPSPESLAPDVLISSLARLRKSTEVILSFGHFITKDMKAELETGEFKGVAPVMAAFLAMTGAEVLDISYFGVRGDGGIEEYGPGGKLPRGVVPGVRMTFRRNALAAPQRVHYVQADVSDDGLSSNRGVLTWTERFGTGNSYLKAASYLMHEPYFSKVRSFLLGHSRSVLQDDSGIPFSFFQDGLWRCWFFGTYTGTLDIFKKYHQTELSAAFAAAGTPLAFGTGYKWRVGESNLMLAVRQDPPRAEPVTPFSN